MNVTLKTAISFTILGFAAILSASAGAQDVCNAFAKYGIYDTRSSTSDVDKVSSFHAWFCQSHFQSKQDADNAALSLGYEDFNLGFNSNSENWSTFTSNYCRDDSFNTKYRHTTEDYVHKIDATASNNMLQCFLRGGLHARIIPGARPDAFYFQTRMAPVGNTTQASVTFFEALGATKCDGPIVNGFDITAAGAEMICTRAVDQSIDVTITASEEVNWDSPRGLSASPPPPPPPKKQLISIPATTFINGTNVALDQCTLHIVTGILANKPPCGPAADAAEFKFTAAAPGAYQFAVNYAAEVARPVKVILNGAVVRDQALSEPTGDWYKFMWIEVGPVTLNQGDNIIRLERTDVFPHIHDLRFEPLP